MNDHVIIHADTTLNHYNRPWVSNAYFVTDLVSYLVTTYLKKKRNKSSVTQRPSSRLQTSFRRFVAEEGAKSQEYRTGHDSVTEDVIEWAAWMSLLNYSLQMIVNCWTLWEQFPGF